MIFLQLLMGIYTRQSHTSQHGHLHQTVTHKSTWASTPDRSQSHTSQHGHLHQTGLSHTQVNMGVYTRQVSVTHKSTWASTPDRSQSHTSQHGHLHQTGLSHTQVNMGIYTRQSHTSQHHQNNSEDIISKRHYLC